MLTSHLTPVIVTAGLLALALVLLLAGGSARYIVAGRCNDGAPTAAAAARDGP